MRKATRQQTKEHNRNLVLKTIFENESISRADIARITHLTRTTVSDIVSELLQEGLVDEIGRGQSIGGKSPILLSLIADSRYVIGLDLAHNLFRGAIVNLRGEIKQTVQRPVMNRNGDEAIKLVYEIIDELVGSPYGPLVGIGVGTPGLVNSSDGLVISAVNLDWQYLELGNLLNERYGLPVSLLNDSQAAAMAEFTFGQEAESDENLILINVRHGIGAGLVIGGQLFVGDSGGAGEIGHVVVVREGGLPCRCGNFGCLETVASAQALTRQYQLSKIVSPEETDHEALTLDDLEEAFQQGDATVRQMVLDAGRYTGVAIAGLVGAMNIHNIVLAGDMTRFGEPWLNMICETMQQMTMSRLAQTTQIKIGKVGPDAVILGASALLLRDYSLLFTCCSSEDSE